MGIGPVVSKICPGQIWPHWAFYLFWAPGANRAHILHTSKSSSSELKVFLRINWKRFTKLTKILIFTYSGPIRVKKNPKNMARGLYSKHF